MFSRIKTLARSVFKPKKPSRRTFMAGQANLRLERLEDRCVPAADLVMDIRNGAMSSNPTNMVAVGGSVYFAATDGVSGQELWKSDGTTTVRAADINQGAGDSNPTNLTVVGNKIFFSASDAAAGRELWVYDVTTGNATMVLDIRPGAMPSHAGWYSGFVVIGSNVFFSADNGNNGLELWKSDGTVAGTVMVKDINTEMNGATESNPMNLTAVAGTLYFSANNGPNGRELWKSDGTQANTVMVTDINNGLPSSIAPSTTPFAVLAGEVYFAASNGMTGTELWKSGGTAATTAIVKDINGTQQGAAPSNPTNLTVVGGTIYFSANDGTNGAELWKTTGTQASTEIVKDIWQGAQPSDPAWIVAIGGTIYFAATDGTNGRELWKSDGTQAGTELVRDIDPGQAGSTPTRLTVVGSAIYFSAGDATTGTEPWRTFGTRASTARVANINGNNNGREGSFPTGFTAIGNTVFFAANDGIRGTELWKTQVPQPQVMGRLWIDQNHNGIQDVGEAPFGGVTVEIYTAAGLLAASVTTDANGEYGFVVSEGQYYIKFNKPFGYYFSPKDQGSDDTKDSDVDTALGKTDVFTLIADQQLASVDAGIYVAQP